MYCYVYVIELELFLPLVQGLYVLLFSCLEILQMNSQLLL